MDKGAHFYRCDFQVHTPRDLRWTGAKCVSDEERQAYATRLVAACRERGIGAIAVTDHHDMVFAAHVQRAASDETDANGTLLEAHERIVVFPGMELTLGVPCQALLIFDAAFPEDLFALAMTALAITPNGVREAHTAETKRLDNISSLPQLRDRLNEHAYLRGRYIIFPNVTNEGKFSLLRTGFPGKYEPPRKTRRLQLLREWSHDENNEVFPRSAGARSPDGVGECGAARIAVGGDCVDRSQDRLHCRDAAAMGAAG